MEGWAGQCRWVTTTFSSNGGRPAPKRTGTNPSAHGSQRKKMMLRTANANSTATAFPATSDGAKPGCKGKSAG